MYIQTFISINNIMDGTVYSVFYSIRKCSLFNDIFDAT